MTKTSVDVERFVRDAILAHGGFIGEQANGLEIHVPNRRALREIFDDRERISARFELPVQEDVLHLTRTHPLVEGLWPLT